MNNKYNYNNAVKLLTNSGKFRISLGLERIKKIMDLLGNPQDKLNCIHVAGTNGKGSVCAVIASILNCDKKKVGLYSSPHIFKYTERIKISALDNSSLINISDEDFSKYVFEINNLAAKNNIDLTEFEILTAVMYKYFADNNIEVAVVETGLGGRFDATNVIKKNLCSVITHIDYDHTERLGSTLDKIAFEKAGIIKPNCPCIVMEGMEPFYDKAMDVGAELEIVNPFLTPRTNTLHNEMTEEKYPLKGIFQKENLALALAAIERCFPQITSDTIEKGLKNVKHPCRFQYIKDYNLIIDASHNPNGINALVESLNYYYPNTKRRFIFGCLRNKDYKKMVNTMVQSTPENKMALYFFHFNNKNSATFDELKTVCPIECKELTPDSKIEFNNDVLTIICGSFYMIDELTRLLKINQNAII